MYMFQEIKKVFERDVERKRDREVRRKRDSGRKEEDHLTFFCYYNKIIIGV